MTLSEFYKELNKTKTMLNWCVDTHGRFRAVSRGKQQLVFCPLTAVAYHTNQIYLPIYMGFAVTVELEMDPHDTSQVLMAADNENTTYISVRRALRQILFGASGE